MVGRLFLAFATLSLFSFGFPENTKHGYVNCTSCHVSPSGGGVLTPYGRSLSNEVMSTWGSEKEAEFLWGVAPLPNWLQMGGDIRWIQIYQNTPALKEAQTIFMQADLDAAVQVDKFFAVGSVGKSNFEDPKTLSEALVSHRHYIGYRPTDQMTVRAGKFLVPYGINSPEHVLVTRRSLGFDQDMETYTLEGSYLDEAFDVFVSGSIGRPDNKDLNREKSIALKTSYNVSESGKVGMSYGYFSKDGQRRHLTGPYTILGLSEKVAILAEIAFQNMMPATNDSYWGWVNYLKFDYEVTKGLHLYAQNEISHLNFNRAENHGHAYGLGVQFLPRPHFTAQAVLQKRYTASQFDSYTDFAYLLLHYYF